MAKMRKKQKDGQIENQPKKKRHYKRWDEDDKYTLEVAMRIFGITNYSRISAVCVDRNESQVSISKSHLVCLQFVKLLASLSPY
jgi:hypothetical protein